MHTKALIAVILAFSIVTACNKTSEKTTDQETTEQIQAATEITNALARMGEFNDSVVHHHGTPLGHHFDTLFHHHDSVYIHYHDVYHQHDTIHHPTGHHIPVDHHIHDSIITAHHPYH
jgi:hypothetical protein